MELLQSVLEEIHAGRMSFQPEDQSEAAFSAFQPVANRLIALKERGLVHDVKVLRSHSRTSQGILTAMVLGGLTFDGEQFLASTTAPPPSPVVQPDDSKMKVFVSHSSVDALIAEAFIDLLRSALGIKADEIRCTSVPGYKLPAGVDSNEQLRREVFESTVFVALLSPQSLQSTYVMFELGARWGAKRYFAPILVKGATASLLKQPLSGLNAVTTDSDAELHKLLHDIGG